MGGLLLAATNPGLVVAFAAGMLSFLSPCVLPLVPGYLSLMSGVGTADLAVATKTDTRRLLRSTLLFVGGFTVVFVALGAGASAIGRLLNDHQVGLNQLAGAVVIVMGLAMAGVVSPRFMQRERRVQVSPSKLGSFAAPVMGMAFAFGWTPCLGPVLASVLSLATAEATLGRGVALLLAYSLGLGVPFVLTGVAFGRMTGALDWVKRRARVINLVSGLLLAGFGYLLLTNRLTDMSRELVELMDGIGLGWLIGL
ncbi:MAG TPA: cytochrome c biogenesis protein CcdA [Acidimicrobiales bacterium]|nr:cytochrome c biogenesis protein CcdA [Acidimicrobiales bacterium]